MSEIPLVVAKSPVADVGKAKRYPESAKRSPNQASQKKSDKSRPSDDPCLHIDEIV